MIDPINKLCKWRSVLAGWHHGTKVMNQDGARAMRDLMDKFLMARVESTALTVLLIQKGVFTAEEFHEACNHEATLLDQDYEKFFPGFRTSDQGVVIYDTKLAAETTRRLGFPP